MAALPLLLLSICGGLVSAQAPTSLETEIITEATSLEIETDTETTSLEIETDTEATSLEIRLNTQNTSLETEIYTSAISLQSKKDAQVTSLVTETDTLNTLLEYTTNTEATSIESKSNTQATSLETGIDIPATSLESKTDTKGIPIKTKTSATSLKSKTETSSTSPKPKINTPATSFKPKAIRPPNSLETKTDTQASSLEYYTLSTFLEYKTKTPATSIKRKSDATGSFLNLDTYTPVTSLEFETSLVVPSLKLNNDTTVTYIKSQTYKTKPSLEYESNTMVASLESDTDTATTSLENKDNTSATPENSSDTLATSFGNKVRIPTNFNQTTTDKPSNISTPLSNDESPIMTTNTTIPLSPTIIATTQPNTSTIISSIGNKTLPRGSSCQFSSTGGADYYGSISRTETGLLCQWWSSTSPHHHQFNSLQANYCRNPDGTELGVWCFTMDHRVRWERCDVPICKTARPTGSWRTVFSLPGQQDMMRGSLLATIPSLPREWRLSLQVFPTNYSTPDGAGGYESVLHLTTGSDLTDYGSRTPAIWMHDEELHVTAAVNGNKNFYRNFPRPPAGKWTGVQVSQELMEKRYVYRIVIGNKTVYEVQNRQPRAFSDVKVFSSDPWYPAQPGAVRRLLLQTKE